MSIAYAASRLANVFSGDVPSRVDPVLDLEGVEFTTIAYNDRGTYLAAGCNTGELVIWDLITFTPALRVTGLHSNEINAVTWVRQGNGRLVCTTSADGWVKVFDLETKTVTMRLHFDAELVGAAIHPNNLIECLACLGANKHETIPWPGLYRMDQTDTSKPIVRYIPKDFETHLKCYGVAATFSKHGRLVFVGGVAGAIFVFGTSAGDHIRTVHPDTLRGSPKGWMVALALSRNGRVLLSDGGGRAINVFDVASDLLYENADELPVDASLDMIQDAMRWRTGRFVTFKRHLQDVVGASKWNDVGCSGHSEFVFGASSAQDVHEIFIWEIGTGRLVNPLSDKNPEHGGIQRCIWHPWRPQIAVVTSAGSICLWNATAKEELAFPPGFSEIEESIVTEDAPEGDNRIERAQQGLQIEDPEPVDVLGNQFPQVFSDDEDSDEDKPSVRKAPRCVTRHIGYFIPATQDRTTVDASQL